MRSGPAYWVLNVGCIVDAPGEPVSLCQDDELLLGGGKGTAWASYRVPDIMVASWDMGKLPHDDQLELWSETQQGVVQASH
jgi:hypothetical protein